MAFPVMTFWIFNQPKVLKRLGLSKDTVSSFLSSVLINFQQMGDEPSEVDNIAEKSPTYLLPISYLSPTYLLPILGHSIISPVGKSNKAKIIIIGFLIFTCGLAELNYDRILAFGGRDFQLWILRVQKNSTFNSFAISCCVQ